MFGLRYCLHRAETNNQTRSTGQQQNLTEFIWLTLQLQSELLL